MGLVGKGNGQHFLGRGHFQVQGQVSRGLDALEVIVADMAAVFAQVRGDAIAAHGGHDLGRADRIGMVPAARIADRCHVIDVHAQTKPAGP